MRLDREVGIIVKHREHTDPMLTFLKLSVVGLIFLVCMVGIYLLKTGHWLW